MSDKDEALWLINELLADESGYDEEVWPEIAGQLGLSETHSIRPGWTEAPEEVAGWNVWGPAPLGVAVTPRTIEARHYCPHCDEIMRMAWGESCPICCEPVKRVLPSFSLATFPVRE